MLFIKYVDRVHKSEELIKLEYSKGEIDQDEMYYKLSDLKGSGMDYFNEISPWEADGIWTIEEEPELYQRKYYSPSPSNGYPFFDLTEQTPYHYSKSRLHAINIGIQIWNCEIDHDQEREEFISYSLWEYLEEVKQGDLIEYRGWYMQVKDFTKQQ